MYDRLFLPETISEALDNDLVSGLRAIADALESGQLDGKHLSTIAAAGGRNDDRIHLRVTLGLAAPILQSGPLKLDGSILIEPQHGIASGE